MGLCGEKQPPTLTFCPDPQEALKLGPFPPRSQARRRVSEGLWDMVLGPVGQGSVLALVQAPLETLTWTPFPCLGLSFSKCKGRESWPEA